MVRLLEVLAQKYKRNFTWKYFATSHGEGIVDGVGGRAKSIVRTAVMSKKDDAPVVQSSLDFANVAKMLLQKTTVFHMSQIEIDDRIKVLKPWSEDPTPIPGIQKIHVIHHEFNGVTKLWKNAMETAPTVTIGATDDNEAVDNVGKGFTVGDWCVVNYEGARFPGEIVGIQNEEVQVSVMHKAGRYFSLNGQKRWTVFIICHKILKKGSNHP